MAIIKPRTTTVTIVGGDYAERLSELERAAEKARSREEQQDALRESSEQSGPPLRSGQKAPTEPAGKPESVRLAEEHDALFAEAEAAGAVLVVTLQALRRSEWKALVAQHKPRVDNKEDAAVGVNEDTFREALVPVSVVSPELDADDYDALAAADFDRLYVEAFALNRMSGGDPKAGLVSRMSQQSSETSS